MTWGAMLGEQLDFYRNAHFWPRIQGVTDEEYLWEPAAGAWSLRPGPDGPWVLDQLPLDPPVAPVTTIA
ncbi:MAG: DinB family protein, partial [Propioniciclava sp.]